MNSNYLLRFFGNAVTLDTRYFDHRVGVIRLVIFLGFRVYGSRIFYHLWVGVEESRVSFSRKQIRNVQVLIVRNIKVLLGEELLLKVFPVRLPKHSGSLPRTLYLTLLLFFLKDLFSFFSLFL